MKRNAKRLAMTLTGITAVLACAEALAQLGPSVNTPPGASNFSSGPKPTLISPTDGAPIETHPTQSRPVLFRWSAPAGGPTVDRYELCVRPVGATCAGSEAAIYQPGRNTQYQAQIPPRFHDKMLQWSVAACGAGYGSPIQVSGQPPSNCSWSTARALNAGYQPPALNLLSPFDQAAASTPSQRFTWSAPPPGSSGIDGYRFCLADDISACHQASLPTGQGVIAARSREQAFADVDVRNLRRATPRTMVWTVLTCRDGTCRLAANQATRRFVIGGPPAAPALESPQPASLEPVHGETRTHGFVRQEDGHVARGLTFPARISFRWSRVSGATHDRLCISTSADPATCESGSSYVERPPTMGGAAPEWSSLNQLHGQSVYWSASACDALGCGPWATMRPITILAVPGTPNLLAPNAGLDLTSSTVNNVTFQWTAVPFASEYAVRVGDARMKATRTDCTAIRGALARGATEWTVQACNVVGCGPEAPARAITINAPISGARSAGTGQAPPPGTPRSTRSVAPALPVCIGQ